MAQNDMPSAKTHPGKSVDSSETIETGTNNPKSTRKGPRFWAILFVLSLSSLLTALEATITSTVLPVIVAELGGGDDYIWVANGYFLTM